MPKRAIRTEQDFEDFFEAFSRQDWDLSLSFLSDGCIWDASERRLQGLAEIKRYWTGDHASIRETLSKPKDIIFGPDMAYLQVVASLEFITEGTYMGRDYPKGSVVEVPCVDVYTFAEDGTIKECRVYTKLPRD